MLTTCIQYCYRQVYYCNQSVDVQAASVTQSDRGADT